MLAGCGKPRPAAAPVPARDPLSQLHTDITAFIDQPAHRRGTWGIVVQSLPRGDRLFELNPRALLVPASTLKIITAAVVGTAVGWDYTFDTTVEATGPVEDGVIRGDLVVTGTGDPSILGRGGTDYTASLVAVLQQRGIVRIDGRIIGNDNLVEEPRPGLNWAWEDLGTGFGAMAGALNMAENRVRVAIKPGPGVHAPTSIEVAPEAQDIVIANRSTTGPVQSEQTLWAEYRPGETALTIAGTIAADAVPASLAVSAGNPTLWFVRLIRARLIAAGIDVTGPAVDIDDLTKLPDAGASLDIHHSRPLSEITHAMMKHSINMYGEALLRLATGRAGPRTTEDAIVAARMQLETWGIPQDAVHIADGSGLSRRNLVTPEALIAVLQRFYDPDGSSPFMQALPIAGVDGTLTERLKDTAATENARAKTGTMANVRSLAGYVTTGDGETLAFAILANNFEGAGPAVTATIDRIVVRLASFRRAPALRAKAS